MVELAALFSLVGASLAVAVGLILTVEWGTRAVAARRASTGGVREMTTRAAGGALLTVFGMAGIVSALDSLGLL